jgi:hypothetical protein
MNRLNLQFGTPEHGWMEIVMSSSANATELVVSDVPCNSLYGLTKILLNLIEGGTEEIVEWSLEPEYSKWIFKRKMKKLSL